MKEALETEFNWNYRIPKGMNYFFEKESGCPLCENEKFNLWSAPYISAGVDTSKMKEAAKNEFDLHVTDEQMVAHRGHIRAIPVVDDTIRDASIDAMKLIESDLPEKIDEKKLLESNLKQLWARRLFLEKTHKQDTKEYMDVISAIEKHITLKLKLNGEISENTHVFSLNDVIKMPTVGKEEKIDDEPTGK